MIELKFVAAAAVAVIFAVFAGASNFFQNDFEDTVSDITGFITGIIRSVDGGFGISIPNEKSIGAECEFESFSGVSFNAKGVNAVLDLSGGEILIDGKKFVPEGTVSLKVLIDGAVSINETAFSVEGVSRSVKFDSILMESEKGMKISIIAEGSGTLYGIGVSSIGIGNATGFASLDEGKRIQFFEEPLEISGLSGDMSFDTAKPLLSFMGNITGIKCEKFAIKA